MADLDYTYVVQDAEVYLLSGSAYVVWGSRRRPVSLSPYTQADYAQALAQLLPEGPAWPQDPASVLQQTLRALAAELARVEARSSALLAETDPASTHGS